MSRLALSLGDDTPPRPKPAMLKVEKCLFLAGLARCRDFRQDGVETQKTNASSSFVDMQPCPMELSK